MKSENPSSNATQKFIEDLKARLSKLEKGKKLTVRIDLDGCLVYGRIPYVDKTKIINEELLDSLWHIRNLVELQECDFQIDICSTAPIEYGNNVEETRKKIVEELTKLQNPESGKKSSITKKSHIYKVNADEIACFDENAKYVLLAIYNHERLQQFLRVNHIRLDIQLGKNLVVLSKFDALDFALKVEIFQKFLKKKLSNDSQIASCYQLFENSYELKNEDNKPESLTIFDQIFGEIQNEELKKEWQSFLTNNLEVEAAKVIFVDNDQKYHESLRKNNDLENDKKAEKDLVEDILKIYLKPELAKNQYLVDELKEHVIEECTSLVRYDLQSYLYNTDGNFNLKEFLTKFNKKLTERREELQKKGQELAKVSKESKESDQYKLLIAEITKLVDKGALDANETIFIEKPKLFFNASQEEKDKRNKVDSDLNAKKEEYKNLHQQKYEYLGKTLSLYNISTFVIKDKNNIIKAVNNEEVYKSLSSGNSDSFYDKDQINQFYQYGQQAFDETKQVYVVALAKELEKHLAEENNLSFHGADDKTLGLSQDDDDEDSVKSEPDENKPVPPYKKPSTGKKEYTQLNSAPSGLVKVSEVISLYKNLKILEYGDDKKEKQKYSIRAKIENEQVKDAIKSSLENAFDDVQFMPDDIKNDINKKTKFLKAILNFANAAEGVAKGKFADKEGFDAWGEFMNIGSNNEFADGQYFKIAKKFSSNYQKIVEKNEIFSGRDEDSIRKDKKVGMRLKRIPPEIAEEFLNKLPSSKDGRSI